jgi:hypothetical protein
MPEIPIEVVVLSPSEYLPGTYMFPVTNFPLGYTLAELIIDRALWLNPASQLAWSADISHDGGVTWNQSPQTGAAATTSGGVLFFPPGHPQAGQVRPVSRFSLGVLSPENPNRRVRGSFTVSGAPASISARSRLT